jgi:hypothetical protein
MLIRKLIHFQCDPGYIGALATDPTFDTMKIKKLLIPWVALFGMVLLQCCVWENEEDLFPDTAICDTTSVSFSSDIVPILTNNCYGCHSNLNAPSFGGGLRLEDHQDVASNSERIIGAVNHNEGFLPMPKGGTKLDPCPINLIEAWASAGAPDN